MSTNIVIITWSHTSKAVFRHAICVFVNKLPGPGWRAGWGVWNGRATSSSYPKRRPGVRPVARLVSRSYCSWRRGKKRTKRGANVADSKYDFHCVYKIWLLSSLQRVKLSFKSYWECGRISSTSENKRRSTFLHLLQCIYDHLPSTSVNTEQRIDGFVTWFMFVCWYRHWAYLLLPLVCSRMELVTWSFTLLLSATQSWRRSWLNSTSRSSWARLSVYLCTPTHTCSTIHLTKLASLSILCLHYITANIFIYSSKKKHVNLFFSPITFIIIKCGLIAQVEDLKWWHNINVVGFF